MPENDKHKVEMADEFLIPTPEPDFLDLDDLELGEVIPTMTVPPATMPTESECIIADSTLTGLYDEIVENCRQDRSKVDDLQMTFENMVVNDGDASSASKEALVNLIKIKTDINDKMAKVADLMTRLKLRERDTFKPYLAVPGRPAAVDKKKAILNALQEKRRKEAERG